LIKSVFYLVVLFVLAALVIALSPLFFVVALVLFRKQYMANVLLSIDYYGSSVTGGDPHDTISSRLGKAQAAGSSVSWLANMVDDVDLRFFTKLPNHCARSIKHNDSRQVTGR
jgi:hypothetical protein